MGTVTVTRSSSWRSTHTRYYLATAMLLVLLRLFVTDVPGRVQLAILVLLIALVGVPHGALDPLVAFAAGIARDRTQLFLFLCMYVTQAAAVLAVWYLLPVLAFGVFLMLSIYHFSGDWRNDVPAWPRLGAAATIVSAPPLFHPAETAEIFAILVPESSVPEIMPVLQLLAILSFAVLVPGIVKLGKQSAYGAMELASLPVLAWALPPLVFFVVYFCGLHSPRHFIETITDLMVRPGLILLVTVGVTMLTLGICLAAFFMLPAGSIDTRLLQLVFLGLAALTVPHMILMEQVRLAEASNLRNA